MPGSLTGVLLAAFAAFAVACVTIAVRLGTDDGHSADALFVVLTVNILVLVPLAAISAYPDYGLSARSILTFVAAGLTGTMLGRILYYASIERLGASRSEPIKASQPVYASVIAVLVLNETLSLPHALGIVIIVLGVAIIARETASETKGFTEGVSTASLWLPFAAAFVYGLEPIFAKYGLSLGTPVFVGLAIKTLAALIGYGGYLQWRGTLSFTAFHPSPSRRWYLLAGVANTAFLISYYVSLELLPVTLVVPIVQISPIFVVVISWLFLQRTERVTPRVALAALIVILGGIAVTLYS